MIELFITSLVMGLGLGSGFKILDLGSNGKRKKRIKRVVKYLVDKADYVTLANYLASALSTEELILNREMIGPLFSKKKGLFRNKPAVPAHINIDPDKLILLD